jgi:uncharacterized membrane protein YdjX (TVP38/TMEM64 family)
VETKPSTTTGFVTGTRLKQAGLGLLVFAVLAIIVRVAGGQIPRFASWVGAQGAWAPFAYIGGYILVTVLFVPGALPTMAAGIIFGLADGTLYAFVGETLGGIVAFSLARTVARPMVEPRLVHSPRFAALDRAVAKRGRRIVFMLRLSPAVPFNFLNYALGLTTIRLLDYVLASVAMLPAVVLYVYYGKLIGDVAALARGTSVPHDRLYWITTLLGLGVTIAVSVMLARFATRALREASIVPRDVRIVPADAE